MDSTSRYQDRRHAGRILASRLDRYSGLDDTLVLALPRGGVPIGYEVAMRLRAPLDVFIVRKLGVPGDEELAMGALASGGLRILNDEIISALQIPSDVVDAVTEQERMELERRERAYRGGLPPLELARRTVILVDDGLATGSTMSVAIRAVRRHSPRRVIVGVPIAPPSTCAEISELADDTVCAATPELFTAVGAWYANFTQTSDTEVRTLLDAAREDIGLRATLAPTPPPAT
jgi:putative phosphoribosyl transferase